MQQTKFLITGQILVPGIFKSNCHGKSLYDNKASYL